MVGGFSFWVSGADGSGTKSQAIQIALIGIDTHVELTAADFTII
jgi:hypothetical protein